MGHHKLDIIRDLMDLKRAGNVPTFIIRGEVFELDLEQFGYVRSSVEEFSRIQKSQLAADNLRFHEDFWFIHGHLHVYVTSACIFTWLDLHTLEHC